MNRRRFLKQIALISGGITAAPFLDGRSFAYAASAPNNKPIPADWKGTDISISWIGHSTVLINMFGVVILTDPVLFQRVGINILGMTYGPGRYSHPALFLEEMPKPDLVLLSHAHMDHTDYETLSAITDKFPGEIDCITSFNTKDVTSNLEWKSIKELDWGENDFYKEIKISAYEVKHFGWRFPWERDRSKGYFKNGRSYNAYVLEKNGKRILFGGDMANSDKLKTAGLQDIDVAIMPIGAYNPWRFAHCNPEEALAMAMEAGAKVFIPIHCNTFRQGMEPVDEPVERLEAAIEKTNCTLGLKEIGETYILRG